MARFHQVLKPVNILLVVKIAAALEYTQIPRFDGRINRCR